jgi:thiamine biosynthesis protein ThiS
MAEITVTVNGAERPLPAGTTVAGLIELLGIDGTRVAVERNLDVVPRATWAGAELAAGDQVEVVTFVGGG